MVSVGNLSVGGTGKTPVVAAITERLLAMGERPAILSRGYRRADDVPGVVVVSGERGLFMARFPARWQSSQMGTVCTFPRRRARGLLGAMCFYL